MKLQLAYALAALAPSAVVRLVTIAYSVLRRYAQGPRLKPPGFPPSSTVCHSLPLALAPPRIIIVYLAARSSLSLFLSSSPPPPPLPLLSCLLIRIALPSRPFLFLFPFRFSSLRSIYLALRTGRPFHPHLSPDWNRFTGVWKPFSIFEAGPVVCSEIQTLSPSLRFSSLCGSFSAAPSFTSQCPRTNAPAPPSHRVSPSWRIPTVSYLRRLLWTTVRTRPCLSSLPYSWPSRSNVTR